MSFTRDLLTPLPEIGHGFRLTVNVFMNIPRDRILYYPHWIYVSSGYEMHVPHYLGNAK